MTAALTASLVVCLLVLLALWLAEPVEHRPRHAAPGGE